MTQDEAIEKLRDLGPWRLRNGGAIAPCADPMAHCTLTWLEHKTGETVDLGPHRPLWWYANDNRQQHIASVRSLRRRLLEACGLTRVSNGHP